MDNGLVVTIHQPEHLPWLGFFNKMSMADVYVILDDVQYKKNNYQNRNRIMGTNGPQWLSVPVVNKGRMDTTILDIRTDDQTNPVWRKKYLNTIMLSYKKKPFFDEHYTFIEDVLNKPYHTIYEINVEIIFHYAELLDIHPKFIRSSEMKTKGKKSDLVLSICKSLNAGTYISGEAGREYMHLEDFNNAGIKVVFQEYDHPTYDQHTKLDFAPYMSTMDLLMNVPIEEARGLVKNYGTTVE